MSKRWIALAGAVSMALGAPPGAAAEDLIDDTYGVTVQSGVVYGQGLVGASSTTPHLRDLEMDVYRPNEGGEALSGRPAVIMVFGGAFHRGSKGTARFEEDGASDSAMGDWCHAFAAAGYACMSIEYRLVPEDPALPQGLDQAVLFPKTMLEDPVVTGRVDVIRGRMGLSRLDDISREQLWNTIFAASEDVASAVEFARHNAARFGLDPDRIAIGGFSAGAIAAINAAYGRGVPVKAVISLSGGIAGYDLRRSAKAGMPAGLFVIGQNDLEGIQLGTRAVLAALSGTGIPTETAWIPGFGHFYPMGATSLGSDMTKLTLRARVLRFLSHTLDDQS